MTTIINSPRDQANSDGMTEGLVIGFFIFALAGVLFFIFGLPALRNNATDTQAPVQKIEIQLPTPPAKEEGTLPK